MLKRAKHICIVIILICSISQAVSSDDNFPPIQKYNFNENINRTNSDSVNITPIRWPSHYGIMQTGKINMSFDDAGLFGIYFSRYSIPSLSFETPAFSGHEYLFGGAIWVGAIVGDDTLVSTGATGWADIKEFGLDNIDNPTVTKISFPSNYSLRSQFTDTVSEGVPSDEISGLPHNPLHVKITNRSHVWKNSPYQNAIYYDYLIDYIGSADSLEEVYVGFYFDCDVGSPHGPQSSSYYTDDIAGAVRENGISYIIDNDGDPTGENYNEHSPLKAFAFEFLASSFTPTDTNFNWWVSSPTTIYDYGPRLKGTPADPFRDFGTGGLGTPSGDANKYYIMSHKEWDYDQVYSRTIDEYDTSWLPLDTTIAQAWATGVDTRFLISIGPFTIVKGKSERLIFSIFTADDIHRDPTNLDNLPDDPDIYNENLNLENLVTVGTNIRQALSMILNPITPPLGFEIYDSNKISFDQWCFDDVVGYSVYATPVDASTFPFSGTIPPWYIPVSPIKIGDSLLEIPAGAITGLTAVNVAFNTNSSTGKLSETRYINGVSSAIPIIKSHTTTTTQDSIVFEWTLPVGVTQPDYYKVYKYADIDELNANYRKPYYLEGWSDSFTQDSIIVNGRWWFYQTSKNLPYAIVNGTELKYIDQNFNDSYLYCFVSVDENGLESDYALSGGFLIPERTLDFLVITKSRIPSIPTRGDTIINFYNQLLSGTEMSYDIYSVGDSIALSVCSGDSSSNCPNWQTMSKYKYVIIDDGEFTFQFWRDEIIEYLYNGGNLITFGTLANLIGVSSSGTPDWYPVTSTSYDYSIFGVDSIFHAGFAYNSPAPIEDGKFGFNIAESVDINFSSVETDTLRYPLDSLWVQIVNHPTNEPIEVSGFVPSLGTVVTHQYNSLYPSTSYLENLPVGVYRNWNYGFNSSQVYTYGFHLYYMEYEQARNLLRSILALSPTVSTNIKQLESGNLPTDFDLFQNYPNPFNPSTTIEFNIPKQSFVTLTVFNLLGQVVKELTNQEYPAGNYRVTWDGTNKLGKNVSSGIYLYRLESVTFNETKKMLLLK